MIRNFSQLLILIFLLSSCNQKVSVNEYLKEVSSEEEFLKHHNDSTYRISCTYLPSSIMALNELRGTLDREGKISSELFESASKKFSNASYFVLKVGLTNGQNILQAAVRNRQEYSLLMNDLTFNMNRDVYFLTPEKDTIRPSIFDVQRSYGTSPDLSVLFAFPQSQVSGSPHKKIDFVYRDRYFGIPEPVVFTFIPEELRKKLPAINFNKHE
jgi:hypothetical protein